MFGRSLFVGVSLMLLFVSTAFAAPWDIDMFSQPSLKPNEVARAPVKGTVPVGFKPFTMTKEEAGEKLKNPVRVSRFSIDRGRRIWSANCSPCHGVTGQGNGPVGPRLSVPDLIQDTYIKRPDGHIYGTLELGGVMMPRYGFKFSSYEKWDVINYLRKLQGEISSPAR